MRTSQIDVLRSCEDAMRDLGLDIRSHIYISSTKVHEDPMSDFAVVKLECEERVRAMGPRSYVLRVPNVYGVFPQPRANSVLSRWLLDTSDICANSDIREYISLEALNRFIESCVYEDQPPSTYILRGEPLTMSEIGSCVSRIRNLPFQSTPGAVPECDRGASMPEGAVEVPASYGLDLIGSMDLLWRASIYARDLQDRVQTSSRFHRRPGTQHYLQDLDSDVFEHLRRVYTLTCWRP